MQQERRLYKNSQLFLGHNAPVNANETFRLSSGGEHGTTTAISCELGVDNPVVAADCECIGDIVVVGGCVVTRDVDNVDSDFFLLDLLLDVPISFFKKKKKNKHPMLRCWRAVKTKTQFQQTPTTKSIIPNQLEYFSNQPKTVSFRSFQRRRGGGGRATTQLNAHLGHVFDRRTQT
jgi:hypothetical protein